MRVLSMKETTDNRRVQQRATVDGMWKSRGCQLQGFLLTVHVSTLVWASSLSKSAPLMPGSAPSSSSSSSSSPSSTDDAHRQQHHHQPVRAAGFEPVSIPPLSSVSCWNFSVGDQQLGELYSPNYGQHYPSKAECIHLIRAPDQQRVRLDFRDDFHIEPSEDCGNDQLEIRDGPFGYSALVGRFCGTTRPPLIESTGGYLWLRFFSDDSIEYVGFRAVYEYYSPKPGSNNAGICRIDVDREMPDGQASDGDVPTLLRDRANRTKVAIDCTWVFQAQVPRQTVFLRWQRYVMSTIHLCDDSFLEVYDGTTGQVNRRQTFCDSTARDLRSTTSVMYLRLYASSVEKMPYFTVLYTYVMTEPCGDDGLLFDCGDKTCVDRSLLCNGRHNCNTSRDESLCDNTTILVRDDEVPSTIRYHTLIIAIVGGAVLTITLLSICAAYRQTTRDRQLRRRRRLAASKMENHCSTGKFELTEIQKEMDDVAGSPGSGQHHKQPPQQPQRMTTTTTTTPMTPLVDPESCSSPANHFDPRRFRRLSNGIRPNTTSRTFQPIEGSGGSTDVDGARSPEEGATFDAIRRSEIQCQNVISAVATIEKLPSSSPPVRTGGATTGVTTVVPREESWAARRDSTPSPRPDVVQDEKFFSSCVPTARTSSSGRGCAPSPPVRRTAVDGRSKREVERPSCNRTRSVENATSSNVFYDLDNGATTEEWAATCGSYRDPEAIRSYRRLDFDDADDYFRKDAAANSSAKAFVRFSPDWSAAVTLRRPPFPRDYTGLESSSVSARSAPSLILPLFQGQNAYGSIHQGYRMPTTTHTDALTAVPSVGTAGVRPSLPVPPPAASSVIPRTPGNVSTGPSVVPAPPGLSSKSAVGNSTGGTTRQPAGTTTRALVNIGDPKSALKPATTMTTSSARTADLGGSNKSRRRSKSPDIFYTRPNRGILKS